MNKDRVKLLQGDFRVVGKEIPDGSVDMIFTDPPYLKEHIPLYKDLAKFAHRVLKNGRSLICYTPHYKLNEICKMLDSELKYNWMIVDKQAGPMILYRALGVFVKYKPLLWYIKLEDGKKYKPIQYLVDVIQSEYQGKEHHEWQQSTAEAEYLIEKLSNIGETICDPFMGSGTTGIAALQLNRNFIGIEIEEQYHTMSEMRITEAMKFQQLTNFTS